jgi:hypothetical protein
MSRCTQSRLRAVDGAVCVLSGVDGGLVHVVLQVVLVVVVVQRVS